MLEHSPIIKAIFLFVGIILIISSIGIYFLGVFHPSDEVASSLAGIAVALLIVGAILLLIGKKIKAESNEKSHSKYFQCEYCKMVFEKEVDKINHYLICEKRKKEEPHKELDEGLDDTKLENKTGTSDEEINPSKKDKPSARIIYDKDKD